MVAIFLRLLVALAVLMMPLAMIGGGAAAAAGAPHHAVATDDHCRDMPAPAGEAPGRSIDCMMSCAAIPAEASVPDAQPPLLQPLLLAQRMRTLAGVTPEAATPPPRSV
jgi:hypothetical protein